METVSKKRRRPGAVGGAGSNVGSSSAPISYGDHVRLSMKAAESGLIGAEGVLNSEIRLIQGRTNRMDRCVWRICSAYQYSAAKELNEYVREMTANLASDAVDAAGAAAGSGASAAAAAAAATAAKRVDSQLHALTKGKKYEDYQNAATNLTKRGEPVKFGDAIQLMHVNSGKFLTVQTDKTARCERENLRVGLDAAGSTMSHLTCVARLKIDEEAGLLMNNTEIFFKVAERESEFLHCGEEGFKIHNVAFGGAARVGQKCYVEEGETFEVNCSLTKTVWRVQAYDAVDDVGHENLRAGDVVSGFGGHLCCPYNRYFIATLFLMLSLDFRRRAGVLSRSRREIDPSA
jgi:histone H3/H4